MSDTLQFVDGRAYRTIDKLKCVGHSEAGSGNSFHRSVFCRLQKVVCCSLTQLLPDSKELSSSSRFLTSLSHDQVVVSAALRERRDDEQNSGCW